MLSSIPCALRLNRMAGSSRGSPRAPVLPAVPIPLLALQAPGTMSAAEDAAWLRWVTERFQSIAGQGEEIGLEEFKAALQVKEVSAGPCTDLH